MSYNTPFWNANGRYIENKTIEYMSQLPNNKPKHKLNKLCIGGTCITEDDLIYINKMKEIEEKNKARDCMVCSGESGCVIRFGEQGKPWCDKDGKTSTETACENYQKNNKNNYTTWCKSPAQVTKMNRNCMISDYAKIIDPMTKNMEGIPGINNITCITNNQYKENIKEVHSGNKFFMTRFVKFAVFDKNTKPPLINNYVNTVYNNTTINGRRPLIYRICTDCNPDKKQKHILYKRTNVSGYFDIYGNMVNIWTSKNNVLNKDFKLYGGNTESEMLEAEYKDTSFDSCNYDDGPNKIGAFRDCGGLGFQWVSRKHPNTKQATFYIEIVEGLKGMMKGVHTIQ